MDFFAAFQASAHQQRHHVYISRHVLAKFALIYTLQLVNIDDGRRANTMRKIFRNR